MRAVEYAAYGGPEVLQLASVPSPHCGPGEVLVEMHAASVNPVDGKIRAGLLKPAPGPFPARTGRDGAGFVRALGEGVSPEWLGRRVCFVAPRGQGTWAEEVVMPASLIAPIPDTLAFTDAAALSLAGISAWIALVETTRITPGMRVLVHAGAGGVGGMAVQLAHGLGATVIATCSRRNADYVRKLGASETIAYDEVAFETKVQDLDVVLDLMGGDVHRRSYATLKKGGTLVYLNAQPIEDRGAEFGVDVVMAQILPHQAALAAIVARVADGTMVSTLSRALPFDAFAEAHRLSDSGHARGKIVLAIRPPD
ncbi:NADP-dependent oxidoreductase [Microvirga antarctica]|uniref:NADP-dependent oxidoreductase n=1 Tax=Microvirga antarctica TaxID=2819233 RepID=UPI001B303ED4|nr:NADP-dependent oxidoreductase [Microvirga antarctica]